MSAQLKSLIAETQSQFIKDPKTAQAAFSVRTKLQNGLQSIASIRKHSVTVDEPPELGGSDTGPNPVELLLAALGSCQEITYRAYAAALDIPLESVQVKLTGDIDLRGFFGVDDNVRAGYNHVQVDVRIVSSAQKEQLQALKNAVEAHCPVLDALANPVKVSINAQFNSP